MRHGDRRGLHNFITNLCYRIPQLIPQHLMHFVFDDVFDLVFYLLVNDMGDLFAYWILSNRACSTHTCLLYSLSLSAHDVCGVCHTGW